MVFGRPVRSEEPVVFLPANDFTVVRLIRWPAANGPTLAAPSVSGHRSRDDRGVADVSRIRRFRGRVPLSPRGEHAS